MSEKPLVCHCCPEPRVDPTGLTSEWPLCAKHLEAMKASPEFKEQPNVGGFWVFVTSRWTENHQPRPKPANKITEAEVKREVEKVLLLLRQKIQGLFWWRNNTGSFVNAQGLPVAFGRKGSSDFMVVVPPNGKLLGLELKSPTGKQSKAQREFEQLLVGAGGVYRIVRSGPETIAAVEACRS